MDAPELEACLSLLQQGTPLETAATIRRRPKRYLLCDTLTPTGAEVSRGAPLLVAALNRHLLQPDRPACPAGTLHYAVFQLPPADHAAPPVGTAAAQQHDAKQRDRLLVAVDQLVASIHPPVDPSKVTATFRTTAGGAAHPSHTLLVVAVAKPDTATPAHTPYSVAGVVWRREAAPTTTSTATTTPGTPPPGKRRRQDGSTAVSVVPSLAESEVGEVVVEGGCAVAQSRAVLGRHFARNLLKLPVPEGRSFLLRVAAVRHSGSGWVEGSPSAAYLATREGSLAGQVVFTHPSSELRRFERQLSKREAVPFAAKDAPASDPPQGETDDAAKSLARLPWATRPTHLLAASNPWVVRVTCSRVAEALGGAGGGGGGGGGNSSHPGSAGIVMYNTRVSDSTPTREAGGSAEGLLEADTADTLKAFFQSAKQSGTTEGDDGVAEGSLGEPLRQLAAALEEHATPFDSTADVPPEKAVLPVEECVGEGGCKGWRMTVSEGPSVEFKSQSSPQHFEPAARACINAFLNNGGGRLFGGVRDNGVAEGLPLTPQEKQEFCDVVSDIVHAVRPRVPDSLVQVRFHPLQQAAAPAAGASAAAATIGAGWWKKKPVPAAGGGGGGGVGGAAKPPKVVVEVAVGKAGRWPFYFCGPRSGLARTRGLASSAVLPEEVLVERTAAWAARQGEGREDAAGAGRRRRQKKRSKAPHAAAAGAAAAGRK